jgi:hypothetical protein
MMLMPPRRFLTAARPPAHRRDQRRAPRARTLLSSNPTTTTLSHRSPPRSSVAARGALWVESLHWAPFSKRRPREWHGRDARLRPHSALGSRAPNGGSWRCNQLTSGPVPRKAAGLVHSRSHTSSSLRVPLEARHARSIPQAQSVRPQGRTPDRGQSWAPIDTQENRRSCPNALFALPSAPERRMVALRTGERAMSG